MARRNQDTAKPAPDAVMKLITKRNNQDLRYVEATSEVVRGYDLEATSNRHHGKDVYVANLGRPSIRVASLISGVRLRIGAIEKLPGGELRCAREGDRVTVAIYDSQGKPLTRVLSCKEPDATEIDEGLFTWFGPKEDYGTPWSDNSPAYCQVVTVERLRQYAREPQKKQNS